MSDTLINGANSAFVTELALAVESAGCRYGMLLHWGKTQLVTIGNAGPVVDADASGLDHLLGRVAIPLSMFWLRVGEEDWFGLSRFPFFAEVMGSRKCWTE